MARINHQKRNRNAAWAQEKRLKAEELAQTSSEVVREAEMRDKRPATAAQMAVIIKHQMIDLNEVSYLSRAKASTIITAWADAHGWRKKGEYRRKKPRKNKKSKTTTYGACYSSDVVVKNAQGEIIRVEKNPVKMHKNARGTKANNPTGVTNE